MNLPGHLVSGYVVYQIAGLSQEYLAPFLLATVFIDLDHAFSLKRNLRRKPLKFDSFWRTRFHELWGLMIFSLIFFYIWFWDKTLGQVLALGLLIHFVLDFVTGEVQPFYPFSSQKIQIFFKEKVFLRYFLEWSSFFIFIIFILWKLLKG